MPTPINSERLLLSALGARLWCPSVPAWPWPTLLFPIIRFINSHEELNLSIRLSTRRVFATSVLVWVHTQPSTDIIYFRHLGILIKVMRVQSTHASLA